MKYQVSYRDSPLRTSPFPRFFDKSTHTRALRPATPSKATEARLLVRYRTWLRSGGKNQRRLARDRPDRYPLGTRRPIGPPVVEDHDPDRRGP